MDDNTITRIEEKYLISAEAKTKLLQEIEEKYLQKDRFFQEEVLSVYFDTDDFRIANRSIDRPDFRFKLRVRSYNTPDKTTPVFFEVKSKLAQTQLHLGNKRRLVLFLGDFYKYLKARDQEFQTSPSDPQNPISSDLETNPNFSKKSLEFYAKKYARAYQKHLPAAIIPAEDYYQRQFARELDYFYRLYRPKPRILIAADRLAYSAKDDQNFRLTFDERLRFRTKHLRLEKGSSGTPFFSPDVLSSATPSCPTKNPPRCNPTYNPCDIIMEVKTMNAMPLWFTSALTSQQIYPVRFSKYGKIYQHLFEHHLLKTQKTQS